MPVAGVRDHHVRPAGDARRREVGLGRLDHPFEMPEVGESTVTSAAITICCSVAAWALEPCTQPCGVSTLHESRSLKVLMA
jgi:hypothetical protein